MSERRETTLNDAELRPVAEDEARGLPLAEVLAHRRHHHDDGRERVGGRRPPGACGAIELRGVEDERVRRRLEGVRLGQHLAELAPAVAVEVGLRADVRRQRAPEHALGQVEEVARLPQHLAVRELQVEGHGARRVFLRARAGVEDHVVHGERRCARRRRPRRARSTGCPPSRGSSRARGRRARRLDGRERAGRRSPRASRSRSSGSRRSGTLS